jgi:hypothetical protein
MVSILLVGYQLILFHQFWNGHQCAGCASLSLIWENTENNKEAQVNEREEELGPTVQRGKTGSVTVAKTTEASDPDRN